MAQIRLGRVARAVASAADVLLRRNQVNRMASAPSPARGALRSILSLGFAELSAAPEFPARRPRGPRAHPPGLANVAFFPLVRRA
jgi:hypothetical protein